MARVSKGNVIACKRIKGGRAGCWIKKGSKTVFRFVNPSRLSGLGIPIVSAAEAIKMLPGFTGASRRRKTTRRPRGRLGFTFDGQNCRDSQGKFVPVAQCTGRRPAARKKTLAKRKTTKKRKR